MLQSTLDLNKDLSFLILVDVKEDNTSKDYYFTGFNMDLSPEYKTALESIYSSVLDDLTLQQLKGVQDIYENNYDYTLWLPVVIQK